MTGEASINARFVPGAIVGERFILRSRIGTGAVGDVWGAVTRTTHGTVALKLISHGTVSRDAAARFRREASLSASLTHRNIVRVYDFFEEGDGTLALVMEHLRGENARDRLLRTGLLPPSAAVSICTQILSALAHAHGCGIVHRDIKPPNIFLATEPDGSITPKLLDFGIAKTSRASVHTINGQMLGTPRYMSPEQIRADAELDARSDVFSLAVVLYELLTGRSPFAAAFATASLAAVLETTVTSDPRIPPPLWDALERALAKDRNDRYGSATEFAEALREAIGTNQLSLSQVLVRSKPPPPQVRYDAPPVPLPSDPVAEGSTLAVRPDRRRARTRRFVTVSLALSLFVLGIGIIRYATTRQA